MKNIETAQTIELSEVKENRTETVALSQRDYQLVKSVPINISLEIGHVEMTLDQLFSLKVGEVVEMEKDIDAPIDMIVDSKKVAEGNLVAVNGSYAIEVTHIVQ